VSGPFFCVAFLVSYSRIYVTVAGYKVIKDKFKRLPRLLRRGEVRQSLLYVRPLVFGLNTFCIILWYQKIQDNGEINGMLYVGGRRGGGAAK
jgi:hypothetical protein